MIAPGTNATATSQLEEGPVMIVAVVPSGRAEHA